MKPVFKTILITALTLFTAISLSSGPGWSFETHKSVCGGTFYPKDKDELNTLIDRFTRKAEDTKINLPADRPLKALIMPHAGYIYSGLTAAHVSLALRGKQFQKIIIMGPDHNVGFAGCALSNVDQYETPLGDVPLHPDAALLRKQSDLFQVNAISDAREHSVEAEIPFLQTYLHQFKIIPIVMGRGNIQQYANAIDKITDADTLLVVSSDLSHYLPYSEAVKKDSNTIRMILDLNSDELSKCQNCACGIIPILTLIQIAREHHWDPVLIYNNNSGDTAGDPSRVVGYAAIAFYGDLTMNQKNNPSDFSREKGNLLLKLARTTIAQKLGIESGQPKEMEDSLKDNAFQSPRGTFVTLKINNQLRGCIGNLTPSKSILDGVKENAAHAAFDDPRFHPLQKNEFDKIDIEISLLTEPKILEFKDPSDLLAKLRPGVDGVIIRRGMYSATFLPQVWEQLPDKEAFLDHLCQKAGMQANAWRQPGMEVLTYQVQYFDEAH